MAVRWRALEVIAALVIGSRRALRQTGARRRIGAKWELATARPFMNRPVSSTEKSFK
jgi:hypothetical protein